MRSLHINNYHYVRGGSDRVYLNTCKLLDDAGHSVVGFAGAHRDNEPSPHDAYFPMSIDTASAGVSNVWRFLHNSDARNKLHALIADQGPFDIAHLHIYYGRLTASILKPLRDAGIPIVQTLHEYKLACPIYTMYRHDRPCDACIKSSTLNVVRHACKNHSRLHSAAMLTEFHSARLLGAVRSVDRFLCISEFQRNVLRRAGLPDSKLLLLPNFVDTDAFFPCLPEEKEDYVLYFGRVEALKGVPTLVKAIQASGQKLKIVGTGMWADQMQRAISGQPNIEAVGSLSGIALRTMIARAKAVVVPSEWYEPFGLTVIEAKAAGTPVVAADIGGIPELVREGIDGFLFKPGDPTSLADALRRLDASDLNSFSVSARADACARFSPETYLKNLLTVYRAVQQL